MALTEKKAITDKRHLDKLDKIKIQPYKPEGAAIRAAAAAAGMSLQGYILQAVRDRMQAEGRPLTVDPSPAESVPPAVAEKRDGKKRGKEGGL